MSGEKLGETIYDALLKCVHRNTADDEFLPTMLYVIHKCVWEVTASNTKADEVLGLLSDEPPVDAEVVADDKEREDDATDA